MTAREVIKRASISDVWRALGGGPLRHGRGKAFWRDGDGHNVALDERRGIWYDHAHGTGGGVLDLIQAVHGGDRREALSWLAAQRGVTLDDRQPLTGAERRQYARRRARAETAAQDLTQWRRQTLRRLRATRNQLYLSENGTSAIARILLATGSGDEKTWAAIWGAALDDIAADRINADIDRIESAAPSELVSTRRAWGGSAT